MRSFEDRKEKYAWKNEINSYSGNLNGSQVQIFKSQFDPTKFEACDTIFLIDFNAESLEEILYKFGFLDPSQIDSIKHASKTVKNRILNEAKGRIEHVFYANLNSTPFNWKTFKFKLEDTPVVYLNYDEFKLGIPRRDNFRISNLKKGVVTEVNINGKKDMTLTGRRERTFNEMNIIFHYLGTANSWEVIDEASVKKIPSPEKSINLLKTLY